MTSEIIIEGKNIVVTGGGSGIGLELVRLLAPKNNVWVVDYNKDALASLKQEFPQVTTIQTDLSDWDDCRNKLEEQLPPVVHGLVNNAGVGGAGGILNVEPDVIDRIISVNTRAIVNVSQVVAHRFINSKSPGYCSIVNVSSLASKFPTRVSLGYNLSKAAVDMLTKSMALELGPHNIRVNSVNPGIVLGTDLSNAWVGAAGDLLKTRLLARTPIGKCVEKEHVVNTILFLLWDKVNMVHGESILIEGGYSVA